MRPDAETVGRAAIFEALSLADREALAVCFTGRGYGPGEIVFREGDPAQSLFLVGEGTLVATSRAGGGMPREVGRYGRGHVIGETALTDALPRQATVTALGPAVVYELGVDAVDLLRARAPAAARAVTAAGIKGLIRRLRKLEERVEHELDRSEGQ